MWAVKNAGSFKHLQVALSLYAVKLGGAGYRSV